MHTSVYWFSSSERLLNADKVLASICRYSPYAYSVFLVWYPIWCYSLGTEGFVMLYVWTMKFNSKLIFLYLPDLVHIWLLFLDDFDILPLRCAPKIFARLVGHYASNWFWLRNRVTLILKYITAKQRKYWVNSTSFKILHMNVALEQDILYRYCWCVDGFLFSLRWMIGFAVCNDIYLGISLWIRATVFGVALIYRIWKTCPIYRYRSPHYE